MKAIIYAAGLGTRLHELSKNTPKALIKIQDKPLVQIAIEQLTNAGFKEIIINIHHFANQIKEYIHLQFPNHNIQFSDETNELLDTGGGLVKAKDFFDNQPFLAYNVDILTNLNLINLYQTHCQSNAIATLAIQNRPSSRYLLFDDNNHLCGWTNTKEQEIIHTRESLNYYPFAFSGIHIISPEIFKHIEMKGKFSLTPLYLELSKKFIIQGYKHDNDYWFDLGTPEKINQAKEYLINHNVKL